MAARAGQPWQPGLASHGSQGWLASQGSQDRLASQGSQGWLASQGSPGWLAGQPGLACRAARAGWPGSQRVPASVKTGRFGQAGTGWPILYEQAAGSARGLLILTELTRLCVNSVSFSASLKLLQN